MRTPANSPPARPSSPHLPPHRILPLRRPVSALLLAFAAVAQSPIHAQTSTIFDGLTAEKRASCQASGIRLWTGSAPKAKGDGFEDTPIIYPVLPSKAPSPVGAVIVFPGGGYDYLSAHEAFPIAEYFRSAGLAAFVLKYRLGSYGHDVSLLDAQRAVRFVRARATGFGVDPLKIAVIGFSAGGHLAANLSTHTDGGKLFAADPVDRQSCRPQTALLIYPGLIRVPIQRSSRLDRTMVSILYLDGLHRDVDERTPPTFMVVGYNDDMAPYENCLAYTAKLHESGVRFELHVLGTGGHGFGMRSPDPRLQVWPRLALNWLATCEFLSLRVGDKTFTGPF
jgi:acetyl esterase/lipase